MAKKKTPDQEASVNNNPNETSDNKATNITETAPDSDIRDKPGINNTEKQTTGANGAAESSPDKVVSPERILEEKLAEMQDKYLRLSAEYDNYRKRTLREKMDISKYAEEDLLLKIFPVMDDFERALSHLEVATDRVAMKEGIDLIYVKFTEFLKQTGVKEIEALNCPFNFELHDAVAKMPVEEEDKKGKIVEVLQKGYYLKDKVIRHSKVVVGE